MTHPLSEVVQMLRPHGVFSKRISGAGAWGVRYTAFGQPGFSVVLADWRSLTSRRSSSSRATSSSCQQLPPSTSRDFTTWNPS
jgi:hypothetical protein